MTVDEATIQVAENIAGAESGSGSKKQPKGKGGKRTRKNLRQRLA